MIYVIEKKSVRLLLLVTIILLSSFSVGYAYLSQNLDINGSLSILPSASGTVVSSISAGTFKNSASESSNSSYSGSSISLGISLPKVNSTATYEVTIKNNGSVGSRFTSVDSSISNDAFSYSVSGIDTSTIIESGQSVTCIVTIFYSDEHKYTLPSSTTSNIALTFNFGSTTREALKSLTGSLSPDNGNVTDTALGALFTITINNPNNFPVSYALEGENGFVIYNKDGIASTYYLGANSSDTFDIYLNDSTSSIASGTTATINVIAKVDDYDERVSCNVGSVTLTLEDKNKYIILGGGGGIKATPDNIDYSNSDSSSSGIYGAKDGDGYTYYYRGSVSNNYFSFGGYTWRIIRIYKTGNVRLILNDYIRNSNSIVTKAFKTSYSASSIDTANTLVKLVNDTSNSSVNSPIYGSIDSTDSTTLRGWYNNNLKSYEDYIVDSKFCLDTAGGYATSSGTYASVFYYGSYQRIGQDTGLYNPNFNCQESDVLVEKIGLLSADEFVFAGGAYLKGNSSVFLNDFGGSSIWWTLSPAYYDSNQSKVGVFAVLTDSSISDWIDTNTITNAEAIRPVITVDGNKEVTGSGTSSDPYKFK